MSDTNRAKFALGIETAGYGLGMTNPAASNIFQYLRMTSESLKLDMTTKVSDEIDATRQDTGVYRLGQSVSGDVNCELSYGTFDNLWLALLFSAGWSTPVEVTGVSLTVTVSATTTVAGTGAFAGMAAGQWIRIKGFPAGSPNNAVVKILTWSANSVTVSHGIMVAGGPQASCTVTMGAQILNGTTLTSFFGERQLADVTNDYDRYPGLVISQAALSASAGELATVNWSFLGKDEQGATSAYGTAGAGASYQAAPTTRSMSTTDDVYAFFENGLALPVRSFALTLANNLRTRQNIGTRYIDSIGAGSIGASGNLAVYYKDKTLHDEFRNFTDTSMAITFKDTSNNCYAIEIPRVKLTAGTKNASGKNQDVMGNLSFSGFKHETEGVTARIARFPGP